MLRLAVGAVDGIDTLQVADKGIGFLERLQAAFGPSSQVETESVEFNKRFALTVNDAPTTPPCSASSRRPCWCG